MPPQNDEWKEASRYQLGLIEMLREKQEKQGLAIAEMKVKFTFIAGLAGIVSAAIVKFIH